MNELNVLQFKMNCLRLVSPLVNLVFHGNRPLKIKKSIVVNRDGFKVLWA